jgi:hypothetical protein
MLCAVCRENELNPRSQLRACVNCRAHWYRWQPRKPDEIINYANNLVIRQRRMNTFAVVKDDEVTRIDRTVLQEKKFISTRIQKSKQRAKAAVVEFKLRDRKRKISGS